MTVLIWTQHLLGTGHLRRALGLARALAARNIPTTLASGGPPARFALPDGVAFVQLDPVHAGANFSDLRDRQDRPWDEPARQRRAAHLAGLAADLRPAVLVTELFPFGRRAFRHELLPVIRAVRGRGGRVVCSVRDVLAEKRDPARALAMRDLVLEHYDRVLVHGDQDFLPLGATFPHASELGERVVHTGFVLDQATAPKARRTGILVSAGGGRVGGRLLAAAAAARRFSRLADEPWQLVGGAALGSADRDRLQAMLGENGRVETHVGDLPDRLANCRVSVSQAGYNTVAEALMGEAPMVLVPFAEDGETEQRRRAARLSELGRAVLLESAELAPERLAAAIDRATEQDTRIGRSFAFDGAETSARVIEGLIA
ncbi:glycosyltransferase family protein [Geminicoccus roseus]|uniref:glycosyltransferase family protein n=1 Tax=Geminicoccus roseus TaxID=404900 RepID=UPI000408BDF7|nr:glycosyltransferase [Geminicoccus roseus]